MLSQLEHAFNTSPQFSLQKLWFYVHPTLHTLSLIYQLTTELASVDNVDNSSGLSSDSDSDEARNEALGLGGAKLKAVLSDLKNPGLDVESNVPVKGGEVLSVIYERMQNMSGDPAALTLYGSLLGAAGAPYAVMLQEWINSGKLHDPWEELCVKESKSITKGTLDMDYVDEYWDRRYTVWSRYFWDIHPLSLSRSAAGWFLGRGRQAENWDADSERRVEPVTWRSVYTSRSGGLETQDSPCREIPQRHPRVWERSHR